MQLVALCVSLHKLYVLTPFVGGEIKIKLSTRREIYMKKNVFYLFALLTMVSVLGCGGGSGGTVGDENDPEATSDEEQQDEEMDVEDDSEE